jgi:hypothetical protein
MKNVMINCDMIVQRVQSVAWRSRSADLRDKNVDNQSEFGREMYLRAEWIKTLYTQKAVCAEMCVQFKWKTKVDMYSLSGR